MIRLDKKRHSIPLWRDIRILRIAPQVLFVAAIGVGVWWLAGNLRSNLTSSGLNLEFRFLGETAGFPISEGISYDPTRSNGYAFWVGIVNTMRVAWVGILLATVIGIARLSSNWLVRKLAAVYVETIRNIPLLVQLFFWYFAVILTALPLVTDSLRLPGSITVNHRGLCMPWPTTTSSFQVWRWFLVSGTVLGVAAYVIRRVQLRRSDRPGSPMLWMGAFVAFVAIGWLVVPGHPLKLDVPVLERFNFVGGLSLSAPFMALLIALSTYTAAFIAEIVRAGIQAVDSGQAEAARALGLRILQLVVLPQAMRVMIPPWEASTSI